MRAQLKHLHSPDVWQLETYVPEEADCFGFLLQAMIGPEGEEGANSFDFLVYTPKWLLKTHKVSDVVLGAAMLLVFEYDFARIEAAIKKLCDDCVGDSWEDITLRLSRFGHWEFASYEECQGPKIRW